MNKNIRTLLLLCLSVLCICALVSCDKGGTAETEAESTSAASPATDAPTDPETVPETDPETETKTEAETLPPEDLSLLDGYLRLLDVEHQQASKKEKKNLTMSTEEENGVSYVNYKNSKDDGYIYLIKDGMIEPGRYLKIKYRTSDEAHGQIFLGVTDVKATTVQDIPYVCDGEWHVATLDLWENWGYSGKTIAYVRLDPADLKGQSVDVEWMAFYPDDGASFVSHDTDHLPTPPTDDGGTGIKPGDGSVYSIDGEALTLDIVYRASYFNRYTFSYSASEPLKASLTYRTMKEDGTSEIRNDEFFLEAGDDMTFSSLLPGYFDGEFAYGIDTLSLESIKGTAAEFELQGIGSDCRRIYASGTYFLENDRYRLGILLQWGGGISYIEDKLDGDDGLGNLINRADTGRLVQQSYYGVSTTEYHKASYNGSVWSYNPVQGGDVHGRASRIVDIRLSDDGMSLYIKCRPMDWAQNNMPTKSYMENTYTVTDTGIVVDNRFVDFFYGMKHGNHHQELPAFYTISYLGVFHYYNGTKPWTGDAYETLPNEEFWGGRGSAYHNIRKGNTETWAMWTDKNDYGIGLYVPNIEIMLAGRFSYNGSKDPANSATNYVAPLRTMEIKCFEPWAYTYVIAAGTVDEMRETFRNYYESLN